MHVGVVGSSTDFDVVIKYLQTIGKTKILSNPKIAVTNNQEAKIHVGQKEAYVTTTTTTGQTTNTVSEQVTFVDVGVIISVVPTINKDGYVILKLKTEINSVIDTLVTPTNNKIPIIDTSLAETTVMAREGSTILIGGLKKEPYRGDERHRRRSWGVSRSSARCSADAPSETADRVAYHDDAEARYGDTLDGSEGSSSGQEIRIKPAKGYTPKDTGVEAEQVRVSSRGTSG